MKEGKAEYFVAVDIETKEEVYVKVIPPQPEGDDLGGITEEERKKIYKNEEELGNKITKFYASNQGETHITDSDNGKIQDMMLYGRSEQNQYRGKNLLPTTMYSDSTVRNGVTFINNGDGSVTVSGTATDMTYFTLWGYNVLGDKGVLQGIAPGDVLYVSDCLLQQTNSETILSLASNMSTQFYDSTTTMYVAIKVNRGESVNKTFYPQIEKGSVATSYEPYTGGKPSPSPDYPQEIKSVVNPTVNVSNEDGTKSQTVTLPYTLNAIPVNSGGNVTINGQQYIADYVDVEKGVLVRKINSVKLNELSFRHEKTPNNKNDTFIHILDSLQAGTPKGNALCKYARFDTTQYDVKMSKDCRCYVWRTSLTVQFKPSVNIDSVDKFTKWLESNSDASILYVLATPQEISLAPEEIIAFKALTTYYSTTNISVNSEQLEGYAVFDYPISMANGWNYVKQQLNDNRDYIYDMDTQSAEAYVNSEYAVALTELEV